MTSANPETTAVRPIVPAILSELAELGGMLRHEGDRALWERDRLEKDPAFPDGLLLIHQFAEDQCAALRAIVARLEKVAPMAVENMTAEERDALPVDPVAADAP